MSKIAHRTYWGKGDGEKVTELFFGRHGYFAAENSCV